MPVAPAAYHVLLGWSYLDTRGVDVVSHGNDEVAPSPYLGMGSEPVFPLDERNGCLDCFPNFPIPFPDGFERACHVAFIDDFHCYIFFVGRLSPPRFYNSTILSTLPYNMERMLVLSTPLYSV